MQRFITPRQWWLYNLIINLATTIIVSTIILIPVLNQFKQSRTLLSNDSQTSANKKQRSICQQNARQWQQLQQRWPQLINPKPIQSDNIIRKLQSYDCQLVNFQREINQNKDDKTSFQMTLLTSWPSFIRLFNHFEYQGNWLIKAISLKPHNRSSLLTIDLTLEDLFHD